MPAHACVESKFHGGSFLVANVTRMLATSPFCSVCHSEQVRSKNNCAARLSVSSCRCPSSPSTRHARLAADMLASSWRARHAQFPRNICYDEAAPVEFRLNHARLKHNCSTIFARWRQCNERFFGPTPLTTANGSLVDSAVFAWLNMTTYFISQGKTFELN